MFQYKKEAKLVVCCSSLLVIDFIQQGRRLKVEDKFFLRSCFFSVRVFSETLAYGYVAVADAYKIVKEQ